MENTEMEKTELTVRYPEFAERLKTALSKRGKDLKYLADELKVSYEMVRRYSHGYAMPRASGMEKIAKCLKINAAWLQFGTGEISNDESNLDELGRFNLWDDDTELSEEYIYIPLFKDVRLSTENGAYLGLEFTTTKIPFSKHTLRMHNVAYDNAACATVTGTSMENTLPHGTVIGIDLSKTNIIDGKIYVIYQKGLIHVRRLYLISSTTIRIHCDNEKEYKEDVICNLDDIHIIGKVFSYQVMLD